MDDALLVDLVWLADSGESRERVAVRLGYARPETLEQALYRVGRCDLIRRLHAPR